METTYRVMETVRLEFCVEPLGKTFNAKFKTRGAFWNKRFTSFMPVNLQYDYFLDRTHVIY
jgi:hypothetical protein